MSDGKDDEPNDDRDSEKEEWLNHPFTQRWLEQEKVKVAQSLKALLGICSTSTDANVRGEYGRYAELCRKLGVVLKKGMN